MLKIVNPFVYEYINQHNAPSPTIPPWIHATYSQCFEDIVLVSQLSAYSLRNSKPLNPETLTYIEIGANHPVCTSSTYLINQSFNVSGFLVEPNPALAANLMKYRKSDNIIEAAVVTGDEKEIDF